MLLARKSNREEPSIKKSVTDVVVEDEQIKQLIVDRVNGGAHFTTIKKIFHITLLYFVEWNQMKTLVYYAQMVANEVGSRTPLNMEFFDARGTKFEVHNVFPEFFFICVPLFNDEIKRELDKWLYVMKNSETKNDFKSPCMKQVDLLLRLFLSRELL